MTHLPAQPIRIGMFGCGGFARRYHIPHFARETRARLSAVFDPGDSPELAAIVERTGARRVATAEELCEACDAVIVSTPHALHASHVRSVLEHGRHCLVDKPFVLRAEDARALADLAAARDLVNGVAFNRRHDPGCLRARELIAAGSLGPIRYVETIQLGYERAGWFLVPELGGGGPYTGRAAHMADLLPWLLGERPTAVRSWLRRGPPGRVDHGGFIEIDFGALRCHLTCIEAGLHMWDEIRIFGEDGMIELTRPLDIPLGWQMTWRDRSRTPRESIDADPTPGVCTRDFVDVLCGQRSKPLCSFDEAWLSVRLVENAFRSADADGQWLPV